MSLALSRACLRLAAVAALRNVTLAEERVFDSKIGSIEGLKPDERKPVIAVYTEDEEGGALAPNRGPPFEPWVELVFEISMVEADYAKAAPAIVIGCPTTDDELEISLDVLEAQIGFALFEDMTSPLSALFRRAFLGARHYKSMRYREDQKAERFAYRYVVVTLQVPDEPIMTAYDPDLDGLDLLPPTFRSIAKAWPDGLNEKAVASAIAETFKQPSLPRGVSFGGRAQPGSDPRTRLAVSFLRPDKKAPPCPT